MNNNITTEIVCKITLSNEVLDFCRSARLITDDPAHVNMYHEQWQNNSETLPYLIYQSSRFAKDNGEFFILRINGKIEAISGVHVSSFDSNVAIAGIRSWINPRYRAKMYIGHYLLPLQLSWAMNNNLKTIALSFNGYNKRLINYFKRSGIGVAKARNASRLFYNGVHEVPFSVNLQYTEQWVIYDKIDMNYTPNWEKIKWTNHA